MIQRETEESLELTEKYLKYGVLKEKSRDDLRHISLAGEDPSEMVSLVGEYLEEELLKYVEIVRNANEISKRQSWDKKENERIDKLWVVRVNSNFYGPDYAGHEDLKDKT